MSIIDDITGRAKLDVYNNVDLHLNTDEYTFGLLQQGYATVYDFQGTLEEVTAKSQAKLIKQFLMTLGPMMQRPGILIEFSFTRDPDRAQEMLNACLAPSKKTAKNIGLDADPLFNDTIAKMLEYVAYEGGLISFKTSINALSPSEKKRVLAKRKENTKGWITAQTGSNPDLEVGLTLAKYHRSVTRQFEKAAGVFWNIKKLTVAEAVWRLRSETCPDLTPKAWKAILWGDRLPVLWPDIKDDADVSHLIPPSIGMQMFPQRAYSTEDRSVVQIGKRFIAPMVFHYLPQHLTQFNDLFNAVDASVPFRYTISIESGSDSHKGSVLNKKRFAQLFALTNSANKDIVDSADYLLDKMDKKIPWVSITAQMVTWGDSLDEARERKVQLAAEVATWGGPELREAADYPFGVLMDSLPGVSITKETRRHFYSLDDALRLIPGDRPTGAWDTGGFLLRSIDGKLLPYESFSKQQTTWNNLFFGVPGTGKSVFVLYKLLCSCFADGLTDLPLQTLLDIGHSCEGYIDLLHAILPPEKKYQAVLVVLENSGKMQINPFDLPLGYAKPPQEEAQYINNFMESLVTPSEGTCEELLADAAIMLARRMYEYAIEKPEQYSKFRSGEIETLIDDGTITVHKDPYWHEVRDELFKVGKLELAQIAHREAMPNLRMAVKVIVEDEELISSYGHEKLANGAPVLDTLKRMISESVDNYKILAGPSTFDFGGARVVAFNLRQVAGNESPKMVKQTRIMYALAKKAGAGGYFSSDSSLYAVPPLYADFHRKRYENLTSQPKEITYEEFHVPASMVTSDGRKSTIVRAVENEEKTGRKSSVGINAVSQDIEDFSELMIKNASSVFVLFAGDEITQQLLKTRYGLSDDVVERMESHLRGPTRDGAPVYAIHRIKGRGKVVQAGLLTLGPMMMWALCSTEEDVKLRRALAQRVGFYKALTILCSIFSSGTIGESAQKFKSRLADIGGEAGKRAQQEWIAVLANHVCSMTKADLQAIFDGRRAVNRDLLNTDLPLQ